MPEINIQIEAEDLATKVIEKTSRKLKEAGQSGKAAGKQIADGSRQAENSLKKLSTEAKKGKGSLSLLSGASGQLQSALMGLVGIAAITKFFKDATSASLEEEEALRRLAFAVNATGNSFEAAKSQLIEFANAQQARTRFDDTVTFAVLGRILRVTGDVEQAMRGTALAQDIAAASGKDLNFVAEQVAQLLAGETRALLILKKEFGAFVGQARTTQEALDGLQKGFTGAAATEQSYTKSLKQTTNFMGDFVQRVGDGIMPALNLATKAVAFFAKGIEELGELVAFVAAGMVIQFQGAVKAIRAAFRLDFEGVQKEIANTLLRTAELSEDFAQGITDIEDRFSAKRVEIAKEEGRLKAQQSTQDADRAQKAAQARAEAERKAQDTVRAIQIERMELGGMELEAAKLRIEDEKNARLQALDELREKNLITQEELIQAQENVKASAILKWEEAKEGIKGKLSEIEQFSKKMSEKVASQFGDAVADMIMDGKSLEESLKSIFNSIIRDLIRVAVQAAVTGRAIGGISPVAGGILGVGAIIAPMISDIFKFQGGGLIRRGPALGIFGEREPEVVAPLSKLGMLGSPSISLSITQHNTFHATGLGDEQVRQVMRRMSAVTRSGAAEGAELIKSILSRQGRVSREAV